MEITDFGFAIKEFPQGIWLSEHVNEGKKSKRRDGSKRKIQKQIDTK